MSKKDMSEHDYNDRYLWDGTGEPDPEIARLEKSLSQLRHRGQPPVFPAFMQNPNANHQSEIVTFQWPRRLAAVLAMAAAAVVAAFLASHPTPSVAPKPGWEVAQLEGAPLVGTHTIRGTGAKGKLEVGQLLVTNANSRATITVAEIGEIRVDPGSRVRLLQTMRDRKRIALEEGTIHAAIWAPPGEFVVDTPSAVAVDLGCAYTLHIGPDGSGVLRTTLGWVGFHANGRDSFIPAGAAAFTRRGLGPGTPYFEDASEYFRSALAQLDLADTSSEARSMYLRTVLAQARKEDALSLWHLLSRTGGNEREQVFRRFETLVPLPDGVTHDGVLRLDQQQLDLWWNALGLGDISIWRFWEQSPNTPSAGRPMLMQKKQALLEKQAR
jgi:FecR-like protein